MNFIKRIFGSLFPMVITGFILLLIMTLSRVGLSLWQFDRIVDLNAWQAIFISGLRIDIATISYLLILPSIISTLISGNHILGRLWYWILRVWIVIALWLVVYMEITTPPFIIEYDLRPNRLFIEYLIYPKEIMNMLWTGYKLEIFISLIGSLISLFLGWKLSGFLTAKIHLPKWQWRPFMAVIVFAVLLLGARSTLGHRPLNPAMVSFSTDPLVNDLILNSTYSVLFAASQMESEASAFDLYPKMKNETIIAQVQDAMNIDKDSFKSESQPTLAKHIASYQNKPKNIVILLLESHGARYVKTLGGIDASPNLDKLYKEGWGFTRMYATGTRSVRGIEAVTTGFTPTPARSVVKLGKTQTNFFSIAGLLKKHQYHTQFIYGGESHFDNMKSFFLGNGFVDIQDLPTFKKPKFVGTWGASDEDLYSKADDQFTQLSKKGKPFFSLVFSSSNHTPFEYPDNTITAYNTPKNTVENAIKYADYALGQFIKKAKSSSYWDNTIFAVIADHDSRTTGSLAVPIGHFKIPAVIFGGGVKALTDTRLVSQIDLAPTLLSLAGIDSTNPMIGHDLTQDVPEEKQRAMMQRHKNFAWMTPKNEVVILQPGQGISTWAYNPDLDTLETKKLDDTLIQRAHAHSMWGSLALQKGFFTIK